MSPTSPIPRSYRDVLVTRGVRVLMIAFAISYLGDAMSAVTVAWLAIQIAPTGHAGIFVGAAVSAYGLPSVVGAFAFARFLRHKPARRLVLVDCALRTVFLGAIAIARASDVLGPALYLGLLALSSLLAAWGLAGKYTLLAELVGPDARLAAYSMLTAIGSATVIIGPALAGVLVAALGPGPLIGFDALTFAFLAAVIWHGRRVAPPEDSDAVPLADGGTTAPLDSVQAAGGLSLLRKHKLLGLLAVSWFFFLLYGPVEVALPLHVSQDLHRGAGLLGLYWAFYGAGALVGSLSAGLLKRSAPWPMTLVIVAGWGLCLLPFAFSPPVGLTLACFAIGGLIYGPFIPMTYALFQNRVAVHEQSMVLAARGAITTVAAPVGTVIGGPLTAALGPSRTLAASGVATVLLAVVAGIAGLRQRQRQ